MFAKLFVDSADASTAELNDSSGDSDRNEHTFSPGGHLQPCVATLLMPFGTLSLSDTAPSEALFDVNTHLAMQRKLNMN